MAKKKQVETLAIVVLDESGSMGSVRQQTINGFNEYIQSLKSKKEKFSITLVKFGGTRVELVYDNEPLANVVEFTEAQYEPNGMTPLYDAIGRTVENTEKALESNPKKPNVITLIMTDGEENASTDYNRGSVAELIKRLETKGGWVFTYLGANQDAFAVAKGMNINVTNSRNYDANNPKQAFRSIGKASVLYAASGGVVTDSLMNDDDE